SSVGEFIGVCRWLCSRFPCSVEIRATVGHGRFPAPAVSSRSSLTNLRRRIGVGGASCKSDCARYFHAGCAHRDSFSRFALAAFESGCRQFLRAPAPTAPSPLLTDSSSWLTAIHAVDDG